MNNQKERDVFVHMPASTASNHFNSNRYYPPHHQAPSYFNPTNSCQKYLPDYTEDYPVTKKVCKANPAYLNEIQTPQTRAHNFNIDEIIARDSNPIQREIYTSSPPEMGGYRENVSTQAARSRAIFYDFLKKAGLRAPSAESYFNEIKKNLNFKVSRVLNPSALMTTYEKLLQKALSNPRHSKKNWNEEEFLFLASIITYYCLIYDFDCGALGDDSWEYLASLYPGKYPDSLKKKWQNTYKVHLSKVPWSSQEDEILIQVIKEKGTEQHWREIAHELNVRSKSKIYRHAKQCRERWINHLDQSKNRGTWTDQEDTMLLTLYLELGRKWSEIAKKFGNRTENSVKNRWNSMLKKYKTEVDIEPFPKGASLEEAIAWERKIAQLILEAKQNGLCTGPQFSGQGKHLRSHSESGEHEIYRKQASTDSEYEYAENPKKVDMPWDVKSPKTTRHPSTNEKNGFNDLYGNLGMNDDYLIKQNNNFTNSLPPKTLGYQNQNGSIFKEEEKPMTLGSVDMSRLPTQETISNIKPAIPEGIESYPKGMPSMEAFPGYAPENGTETYNIISNARAVPPISGRGQQTRDKTGQEEKRGGEGEIFDPEYSSIFQELFGYKDNSDSFKTNLKDDINPITGFERSMRPGNIETDMRFANLGLEMNPTPLMPPN